MLDLYDEPLTYTRLPVVSLPQLTDSIDLRALIAPVERPTVRMPAPAAAQAAQSLVGGIASEPRVQLARIEFPKGSSLDTDAPPAKHRGRTNGSPVCEPGYNQGVPPKSKGRRYPPQVLTEQEIHRHSACKRAIIGGTKEAPRAVNAGAVAREIEAPMQDVPYGCCHCGCGEKTKVSAYSSAAHGYVKGEPRRYLKGHHLRFQGPLYAIDPETGCWVWNMHISREGYGRIMRDGSPLYAHRVMYEKHVGPIPEGLELDHLCRNRACCNPAHLEPVTRAENLLRGEGHGARNARKTHCSHGHPLSGDNLRIVAATEKRGERRVCRICAKRRNDARQGKR